MTKGLARHIGVIHSKTAAQVALRWLVPQPRVVTLSKTAKRARLPANVGSFDFELSDAEMEAIHGHSRADRRIISPRDMSPDWD
ncbi:aldo/keto reductase [Oceanicola sp. S124]|uniref:aldo/keto reductase n=1 Tax=Oceanicola sp. S124 TaxID=1042378 RepID=UPI001ED8F78B|nr:aldo/keto reductase [Oceanicola sp. S124]